MSNELLYEVKEHVAFLAINREERRNCPQSGYDNCLSGIL